ncbi:armadillo-type protein [Microdochium trichocladiopsis]|uniref:Armadillo-type protein n=1 Tax=Microdochium trichocladiopsis TaxID=1682393 RepID=A0A9P8Y4X3_9PEZI|nr:armadillo-type protein [Microdochium trichocladiopsis]KAH7027636.1 armadillo-type protein [Microdochium trichocladiopsis]
MSFSIEVPGEASPLSLHELFRVLQAASSYDSSQRQSAGQQLSAWEAIPDYYPGLQAVFLDRTLPREVRLLAIIQLKNGIDKYWRQHTAKNGIPPAEKHAIRTNLYSGTIGEPDKQLALHNALVIAKVVRIDFPTDWPDALSSLIEILRSSKDGDQLHLMGALTVLLRIVKELGTARLRKSQTALQSVTPELVYVLGDIYDSKSRLWTEMLSSGHGQETGVQVSMDCSLTAFKILRRLLVVGYEQPHHDKTVQQVWTFSQAQFEQFLGYMNEETSIPSEQLQTIGKHLMQFTKLHLEMADQHPASFAALPNSIELSRAYWNLVSSFSESYDRSGGIRQTSSSDSGKASKLEGPLSERLALKGLLLIRACIKMVHKPAQSIKYRSPEVKKEQEQAISQLKAELLQDNLIVQMVNTIITHLFIFRKSDLEAWEEDPQEWEQQEESQGNAYEWEVRPCAEKLFLDLLTYYKGLLLQPLLAYFGTAQDPQADIAIKEAVYTAMGLAAPIVYENFDFESVLKSTVSTDAQQTVPYCQVLRRRIGILLSQWTPIKASKESRPIIYGIYRHFLNPNDAQNDIVVRITAARQLKAVVDEFGFDGEMFLPFASDVITELVNLLQHVEVDETKLAILETTRSLIERMEFHVSEFGDLVLAALPGIWDSAGDLGLMLKQACLAILQTLVMAMKSSSQRYHPKILPLIAEASQEGTELYTYLIEEALDLWSNVLLQTTPPLSLELVSLAEAAIVGLTNQNEHAFTYMSIVGSYISLAPETMLEDRFRPVVLNALSASFSSKGRELVGLTTKYTEYYIRYAHELGGASGLQLVVKDMMQTGFLTKIFESIHDAYDAHQTSGPKRRQPRVGILTLTDYFTVLSQIAVIDPNVFMEVLASLGSIEQIWPWLSAEWFGSFDTIADIGRQKVNMLALTRLLELPSPVQQLVLANLQDYFSMWTVVMVQLLSEEEPGVDTLVLTSEPEGTEWDNAKDVRERALWKTDPVKTVQSLQFVRERLQSLMQRVGGEQAFQEHWAVNVDQEVLAGFRALDAPRNSAN